MGSVLSKILFVVAMLLLPLSVTFWYRSHASPVRYRFDVTLYKSLDVYLKSGVCGLHLLSMPTSTASKSEFETPLRYNATPNQASFFVSTARQGPYRMTWLVFPFWAVTLTLVGLGFVPVARPPLVRWIRRRAGRCITCGYSLTGNKSGRCPECGDHVHVASPFHKGGHRGVSSRSPRSI